MKEKRRILISAPYMQREFSELRGFFERPDVELVVPEVRERLEEVELLDLISDIDGVICGDDRFTPAVIDRAVRLKAIVKWGTGIDSIDKPYAESKGIPVLNTPGAFTDPVSDSVMAYMLAFARGIFVSDRLVKQGVWRKPPGQALNECVLGIVGVGAIGTAVAHKAKAFGIQLLGNDIKTIPAETLGKYGMESVTLDELLARSDFVTVNCDLNPTSHHLFHMERFRQMKSNAVLINTARGPLVKEPDLIEALKTCEIAGAALDVFEVEPLPEDSPLRKMDQVLLAAHACNASPACWRRVHENSIAMLFDALGLGAS